MTAKARIGRLEGRFLPRHRRHVGVVGIEDKAAGTVRVGDQVMTAAQWEALEADYKIWIPKREEVTV